MHGEPGHKRVFALFPLLLLLGQGCEGCAEPGACALDRDCGEGQACVDGRCAAGAGLMCSIDAECGAGSLCVDGACTSSLPIDDGLGAGPNGGGQPDGEGVVRVDPAGPIDFGSPSLGVSIERTVTLTNVGEGPFQLLSVARAPGTTDEFEPLVEASLPASIGPGEALEIAVLYTLRDGDDDVGALRLETTAGACDPACADPGALEVALVSEFKGARNLLLAPTGHDYGTVAVGASSSPVTLVVKNDGTLQKVLTVSSLQASGDVDHFDFELPPLPLYLSPGQTVGIPVVYRPTAMAEHSMTVTARGNSDSPDRVELSATFTGSSLPPDALVFDPPELVFSSLAVGQQEQLSSRLRNLGGRAVTVTALELPPGTTEFEVFPALALPFAVAPGGQVDVFVNYTSSTGQPASTTIRALNDQESGQVPVLTARGESYVPPGGPNVELTTGPEDNAVTQNCACQATGNVPAANVDLSYRATPAGPACAKPANPSCGVGGTCACDLGAYGDATWSSARTETVRGETWIVDEQIRHEGAGQDGAFLVKVDLLDDCLAVPGSTSYSVNYGCCFSIDCETAGGNDPAQACYPYSEYPHCATECEYWASTATAQDCLQRGPITTRTRVRIYGGAGAEILREFCTTLPTSGTTADVVTLQKQAGYFTIASVDASAIEVAPGAPCP